MLGLEQNTMMRSLFLQENCIDKIEGIDHMKDLAQLNLSDNLIRKVENLGGLSNLESL
jgi:dynein assembly factor 1